MINSTSTSTLDRTGTSAAGTTPRRRRRRPSAVARTVIIYAILIVGAMLILGPFLLSFSTAVKTPQQFASSSPLTMPAPFTFDNFSRLFGTEHNFVSPIAVTVQMTLVILVVQLGCSILAAYSFARLRFPGRDVVFWVYLATMMIPAVTTIVPLYGMLTAAGLRNTFWALVLPTLFGSPYAIFLLREYFRSVPDDLEAAARIDGCGTLRVLWYVVLPYSRPIIATLTVITVVTQWNNFLWPRVITTGDDWAVLTVATAALQSQYNGNWTLVMAATTIALLPLLLVYLIFQRRIVDSIAIGGFK
ncbi:MAG TPA: carbohydrate ABC transporter permease [Microlunatus sp.]